VVVAGLFLFLLRGFYESECILIVSSFESFKLCLYYCIIKGDRNY